MCVGDTLMRCTPHAVHRTFLCAALSFLICACEAKRNSQSLSPLPLGPIPLGPLPLSPRVRTYTQLRRRSGQTRSRGRARARRPRRRAALVAGPDLQRHAAGKAACSAHRARTTAAHTGAGARPQPICARPGGFRGGQAEPTAPESIGSILNDASPFVSVAIGSFGTAGRSRHITAQHCTSLHSTAQHCTCCRVTTRQHIREHRARNNEAAK